VELDELKMPIEVQTVRLLPDSGGAGRFRGAPGTEVIYGPTDGPITVVVPSDGQLNPPRGVWGGADGAAARTWKINRDGTQEQLPNVAMVELRPGEKIRGTDNGGGGYGPPFERDAALVRRDVLEKWITPEAARSIYGVVLTAEGDDLRIDPEETDALRRTLAENTIAGVSGR
jgi:N-methylhydantoinase B